MRIDAIRFDDLPLRRARRLLAVAALFLLALLIAGWPAILNGQPFMLSDTTSYIRGADAAMFRGAGVSTDWTKAYLEKFAGHGAQPVAVPPGDTPEAAPAPPPAERPVTLAGRSIYYGFFLYATDRLAGLRLAAVLQALLAAVCIHGTLVRWRGRKGRAPAEFVLLVAALSVVSPLAYFASYLVPDLFTGLAILAAAHLLVQAPPLGRGWKLFWFVVLCAAGLFHSSNIVILLAVLAIMLAVRLKFAMPPARAIALVFAAVLVAVLGEFAFYKGVETHTGDAPIRPPFVTARLIADGPGRDYLEEYCPRVGFAVCDHRASLSAFSDSFLWSENLADGVFNAVGADERRRIAGEELRFALAVVADRPLAVLQSTAGAVSRQAREWGLREFNYLEQDRQFLVAKLPARVLQEQERTLAFRERMPVRLVELVTLPVALLSLALMLWAVFGRRIDPALGHFVGILIVGSLIDVIVCGALSTPHDRYLMRVAWLLPLGAYLVLLALVDTRRALR